MHINIDILILILKLMYNINYYIQEELSLRMGQLRRQLERHELAQEVF